MDAPSFLFMIVWGNRLVSPATNLMQVVINLKQGLRKWEMLVLLLELKSDLCICKWMVNRVVQLVRLGVE